MSSSHFVERTGEGKSLWARFLSNKRTARDNVQAYLFLLPFLIVYVIFIIYPVLQAAYMSMFKWDLLAPHLNKFVGIKNYTEMLWGDDLSWNIQHWFGWRLAGLASIPIIWWRVSQKTLQKKTATWLSAIILIFVGGALGINAQADGARFSDGVFWSSFGNTLKFVVLSTPVIVGMGLLLALLLNSSEKSASLFRTLFFAPYVFSVAVLTLIWGFLLNPQAGILAAFLSYLNIEPISWLTNPQLAA